MKMIKIIFIIAVVMALAITLTITSKRGEEDINIKVYDDTETSTKDDSLPEKRMIPAKRVSRFLAQEDPRANKYHCNKNHTVCYDKGSPGPTCCNNKCVDLKTDDHYCGACKTKCKYTDSCCNGECVDVWFDKRHCGTCGNKCTPGGYCIYGMCDYA